MIIDCHGHYTTAPKELQTYREGQIAALKDPSMGRTKGTIHITDDQIRESLENAQLKLQRERGTDVTIFSPRASAMGHHIGDATTSLHWTQHCNDLIHRVCNLYPKNFVGVCQLPQTPSMPLANCVEELERCVNDLGFKGIKLGPNYQNFDPLGAEAEHVFAEAERRQLPIVFHQGTSPVRDAPLRYAHPLVMDEIAIRHPELRIVMAHMGHPWQADTIAGTSSSTIFS